jgi:hypothetical protein
MTTDKDAPRTRRPDQRRSIGFLVLMVIASAFTFAATIAGLAAAATLVTASGFEARIARLGAPVAQFVAAKTSFARAGDRAVSGVASATAAAPRLSSPLHGQTVDACADLLHEVTTHIVRESNARRTIQLENRRCRVDVVISGDVRFSSDFRAIAGLADGGSFSVDERTGGARRRVAFAPDGRGGMAVDYRLDGDRRPFDAAAERWLADRLLLLYRRAGLAADERAQWLYRSGGVAAVLREAELVQSSSGRSRYISFALQQGGTTDDDVVRVLRGSLPSSSSARATILRSVADGRQLRGSVGEAWLEAVAATSSSSTQRDVLRHALSGGRADVSFTAGALRTVGRISSSSAQHEVLSDVASAYRFNDALLDEYLRVARGISSSSAQGRTIGALFRHQQLSTAQLAKTLRAVGSISSTSTQGDLLVQVAGSRRVEGEARVAYVDVASAISSSSQRARAFEALERGPRADGS